MNNPSVKFALIGAAIGIVIGALCVIAVKSALLLPQDGAATILVGAVASVIAVVAVSVNYATMRAYNRNARETVNADHRNAKATVTFQHIARTQADGDMIAARKIVRKAERQKKGVAQYGSVENYSGEVAEAINLLLNDLEIVSIGIQRGIIDCSLFRAWSESATVHKWKTWEPYVVQLRKTVDAPKVFLELERMALAWDKDRPNYKFDENSPFCQAGTSALSMPPASSV